MSNLEKEIIKTLAFFDIFDYPLTLLEIYKYLGELPETGLLEIKEAINNSDKIQSQSGYYFLPGRAEIIETRFTRYNIAERKFKKRLKFIKLLSLLPRVKAIFICNTLAYLNCPENHDIDLFIITQNNKIWTARAWVTGILKILNLRPKPGKNKDKLCPSFFVSEENLNLEKIQIEKKDIYLKYWIIQIYPVFDPENIYLKFRQKNNWLEQEFLNLIEFIPVKRRIIKHGPISKLFKKIFKVISLILAEKTYKRMELDALPENLKKMANQDTRVIINNQMLKFHDNDRREKFYNLWQKNLERYSS